MYAQAAKSRDGFKPCSVETDRDCWLDAGMTYPSCGALLSWQVLYDHLWRRSGVAANRVADWSDNNR